MQINKNNLSFGAIKLSTNTNHHARKVDLALKRAGFESLGKGDIHLGERKFTSKAQDVQTVRSGDVINENEFATLFLNYAKECFVIGHSHAQEQKMIEVVKSVDKGAKINLSM